MKTAYALLRKGRIFIQSYSKATTGLWIASGAVYVADQERLDDLDVKIRSALNGSTEGVPHPSSAEWKGTQAPMLEAAGVKSWTTLAKGAKSVGLECDGGIVRMVPSFNYEDKGGTSLPEKNIECELTSPELGRALVMAFDACS